MKPGSWEVLKMVATIMVSNLLRLIGLCVLLSARLPGVWDMAALISLTLSPPLMEEG